MNLLFLAARLLPVVQGIGGGLSGNARWSARVFGSSRVSGTYLRGGCAQRFTPPRAVRCVKEFWFCNALHNWCLPPLPVAE
jgi:hypothetical protein